jgi:hypothetical protein
MVYSKTKTANKNIDNHHNTTFQYERKIYNMKTRIAQAIKIFGIMAIVAAFAAAAFPTRSFAAEANPGKLQVTVYERSSSSLSATAMKPFSGALIEVSDVNGVAVAKGVTNASGTSSFTLAKGVYKVHVTAPGYTSATTSVIINPDRTDAVKLEISPTK